MFRICTILSILLLLALVTSTQALASGPTGPRYTYASFSYAWNKNAPEKIHLTNATPTADGYVAEYGFTNTLTVYADDGTVTGTCARFVGGGENDAGGRTFTQLITNSILIGTFRWPQEQLDEVRATFRVIGMQAKEYSYNTTRFTLDYDQRTGWEFCMRYITK